MKKLALFVHGLGGSAEGTWRAFPKLIENDAELSGQYDVRSFHYSTSIAGPAPSLQTCADALKTEIETRYKGYPSIAIIAHSQGGLIARWHIAERINSDRPLHIDRLLTFATPHHGAGGASVLKWIPGISRQTKALDPNSEFMQALGLAGAQSKAEQKVATRFVVAEDDWVVGPVSATGSSPIDAAVVTAVGHRGLVKPASVLAASFLIVKRFLLDKILDARAASSSIGDLRSCVTSNWSWPKPRALFMARAPCLLSDAIARLRESDRRVSGRRQSVVWLDVALRLRRRR